MKNNAKQNYITTVIHHKVRLDKLEEYKSWQLGIADATKKHEGFIDLQIINPGMVSATNNEFIILFTFKNNELLNSWLHSSERKNWLDQAHEFSEEPPSVSIVEGLAHWFIPNSVVPTWKMTIISFIAIWPLVHFVGGPIINHLNRPFIVKEFVSTLVVTILMSYVALPLVSKIFNKWLKS